MKFLVGFISQQRAAFFLLVIVGFFSGILEGVGASLILPLFQGASGAATGKYPYPFDIVVAFFNGMDMPTKISMIALMLAGVTALKVGFNISGIVVAARLKVNAIKSSREACFQQLMKVGIGFFNKQRSSSLHLILSSHTETVLGTTTGLIGIGIIQALNIVILLGGLLLLSWRLTLLALIFVALVSLFMRRFSHMTLDKGREANEQRHIFNTVLFETINGMKLIRQFSRQDELCKKYQMAVDGFNKAAYSLTKVSELVSPVFEIISVLFLCLILMASSHGVTGKAVTDMGVLVTFIFILYRILTPAKGLNQTIASFYERVPALYEVDSFLSQHDKECLSEGSETFVALKQGICFEHVTFAYDRDKGTVLCDLNFEIERGVKIGVVGSSGAGKTTLVELLMRFYDPDSGRILVDGVDMRNLRLQSWRSSVAVVAQDTFLFNGSIKENIIFGKPAAGKEELQRAAQKAYIDEFINSLPQGYDTLVGDRGVLLSGGQKQRLAIARAIISNPQVLIFDEATSALDSESERLVQRAIQDISAEKTVISIAHRLATIRQCDRILVLDKGYIVGYGTHDELMRKCSFYKNQVKLQDLMGEL